MAGNGKKSCCSRKGGGSLYGGKSRNVSGGKRRSLRRSVLRKTVRRGGKSRRLTGGRKRRSRRTVKRVGKSRRASGRNKRRSRRTVKRPRGRTSIKTVPRRSSWSGKQSTMRPKLEKRSKSVGPGTPNPVILDAMTKYIAALNATAEKKKKFSPIQNAVLAAIGSAGAVYLATNTEYQTLLDGIINTASGFCQMARWSANRI
jgi:hypothetical protein